MKNKEKYLTISQLAHACNTSRATLLRLEKAGLLNSAYTDENNGYRYYDTRSIFRVSRLLTYQDMGITQKELSRFYKSHNAQQYLLQSLENKLLIMEDYVANLRLFLGQSPHLELSSYVFPELSCYQKVLTDIRDTTLVRPQMWKAFDEAVIAGFSIDRRWAPFVSVDLSDIIKSNYVPGAPHDYTINIPIITNRKADNISVMPRSNTISTFLRGGSRDIVAAFTNMTNYAETHNLKIAGNALIAGIITSYPGEDIPVENWVSRVCLPIK